MNKSFELFSKVFSPGSSYTKRISVEKFVKKHRGWFLNIGQSTSLAGTVQTASNYSTGKRRRAYPKG
ncbi:hypothetical protein J43TS9_55640 [Paenibacillus cineris]|nr:hypothetical protein J43TS9_55640 [Paenibacillus cineris]